MIKELEKIASTDVSSLTNQELVRIGALVKALKRKVTVASKEIDWEDFTCFVLGCIEEEDTIGFTKADMYFTGSCFDEDNVNGINYSYDEDSIWTELFKLTGVTDIQELENKFVSCRWMDNYNTCIAKIAGVEYAVLRM